MAGTSQNPPERNTLPRNVSSGNQIGSFLQGVRLIQHGTGEGLSPPRPSSVAAKAKTVLYSNLTTACRVAAGTWLRVSKLSSSIKVLVKGRQFTPPLFSFRILSEY
jgi:hypothetical protein